MTREEMIAKLQTLTFAYVDGLPDTGFTERPLWVNEKGYGYLACDDPSDRCWDKAGIDLEKWTFIRKQLAKRTLKLEDIEGTPLLELLNEMYSGSFSDDEDLYLYLEDLLTLPEESLDHIYCMSTIEGLQFFSNKEDFKKAYERDWCDCEWEELDDDILAECIEQLTEEGLFCGEYVVVCSADNLDLDFQEFIESLDTNYLKSSVEASAFDPYFQKVCESLREYLLDSQVEVFYDELDSVYPKGKSNGDPSYHEAYGQFVNETKANIQKKYSDSHIQLIAKCTNGSVKGRYLLPIADLFLRVLENNTECGEFDSTIGQYVEGSLIQFVESSKWHFGYRHEGGNFFEITNLEEYTLTDDKSCPILWFGPDNQGPIDKWVIEPGKEHGFIWIDQWYLLEYLVDDCNDCFATWYLAECGYWLPDMEEILKECPIEVSESDTAESVNQKFQKYLLTIN